MKFVTHRIYTGKPTKTVAELVKEAQAKNGGVVKTASSQAPAKKQANLANLGDKKAKPFGAKEEEEVEVEDKKEASKKAPVKKAETSGGVKDVETYDAGKKEATEFTNDDIKEPKEADVKAFNGGDPKPAAKTTTDQQGNEVPTGNINDEGTEHRTNDPQMPDEKNTKASADKGVKLGVPGGKYEVIANLRPELKSRTKEYYRKLYGEDYADAMVADK